MPRTPVTLSDSPPGFDMRLPRVCSRAACRAVIEYQSIETRVNNGVLTVVVTPRRHRCVDGEWAQQSYGHALRLP